MVIVLSLLGTSTCWLDTPYSEFYGLFNSSVSSFNRHGLIWGTASVSAPGKTKTVHNTHTHTHIYIYMVLPKPRNWNAAWKLLVVQLCAARYRELYPLLTTLPSSILLWGRVFFCAFLWCRVSAVLQSYQPAKMTDVKEQWICIKFCFKLSKTASEPQPKMWQ